MLKLNKGRPIAKIVGGYYHNQIIGLDTEPEKMKIEPCCKKCSEKCAKRPCCGGCEMCYAGGSDEDSDEFISDEEDEQIDAGFFDPECKLIPILNTDERDIAYVAGPSGSGKSTYAGNLIRGYHNLFPNKKIYVFSRSDAANDPAIRNLGSQIIIDESLIENPIDISKELTGGSIILFDDCNTIVNDKLKKAVDKLMADIMEIGRKLDITTVITNHLVIPNERKVSRTIMNELKCMTVFPKSGSVAQIKTALKTYFGLNNQQIDQIVSLPSRWVTIHKTYPMMVVHEHGAYVL